MGLKDLFIKPVEEKTHDKAVEGDIPVGGLLNPLAREPFPRTAPAFQELDPGPFTEQLNEAMDKADLPGQQSFLAFSKALKNMERLPMDEATKFQAAFATLQATGCEANQLIESFSYFDGILNSEKDKFEEALHATIGDSVIEKENEIKELTEESEKHSAEIEKLTKTISTSQGEIARLQNELAEVNGKLKQKENSFMAAYNMKKQQLQGDAQKIKTYLGSAIAAQAASTTKHKK